MKTNHIYSGDSIEVLKTLPDESVQMCVTSPPYYGLRDYGEDDQIGLEETPEKYVEKLVLLFREVRRVLKDDGTLWLNIGDSYAGSGGAGNQFGQLDKNGFNKYKQGGKPQEIGMKPKDLMGIPWMVAFALRADGWYLRQDIIWHKPNPMPESVKDRCTKAHEYVFLLTKSQRYYYDADAVQEKLKPESIIRNQSGWSGNEDRGYVNGPQNHMSKYLGSDKAKEATHRNKRSVWTVNTKPYKEAHFAVFPDDLIKPCVLAGSAKDDIVLDPFFGSGTTGEVAIRAGRKFVGIELNADYIEIANKRLKPFLTQKTLF